MERVRIDFVSDVGSLRSAEILAIKSRDVEKEQSGLVATESENNKQASYD